MDGTRPERPFSSSIYSESRLLSVTTDERHGIRSPDRNSRGDALERRASTWRHRPLTKTAAASGGTQLNASRIGAAFGFTVRGRPRQVPCAEQLAGSVTYSRNLRLDALRGGYWLKIVST